MGVNENALRVGKIAIRWRRWEEAHDKAAKHARGCGQCKPGQPCPQAPVFPPIEDFHVAE